MTACAQCLPALPSPSTMAGCIISGILLACVTLYRFVVIAASDNARSLLVSTTSGLVLGYLDNTTTSVPLQKWYGVRYAQDTSGVNRWRPPKPFVDASGEVFNASAFGSACLQGRADGGNGTSVQNEDCLRINVIAPVGAKDLPVYIYS